MKDYSMMPLEELMDEYAGLASDPIVKAYIAAYDELTERSEEYPNEPESEFYRAAGGYTYYIELPYDKLYVTFDKAWVKHRDYSFRYRDPYGRTFNVCLSLCGYSREQIERMIDKRIEQLGEGAAE